LRTHIACKPLLREHDWASTAAIARSLSDQVDLVRGIHAWLLFQLATLGDAKM